MFPKCIEKFPELYRNVSEGLGENLKSKAFPTRVFDAPKCPKVYRKLPEVNRSAFVCTGKFPKCFRRVHEGISMCTDQFAM